MITVSNLDQHEQGCGLLNGEISHTLRIAGDARVRMPICQQFSGLR